ncbi:laccase domain protein Mb2173c, partial [Arthrobacter sp. Hiyo6]
RRRCPGHRLHHVVGHSCAGPAAGVRSQLASLGVSVEYSGACTLEQDGLFSYRRDKQTGRFAGLVWAHD